MARNLAPLSFGTTPLSRMPTFTIDKSVFEQIEKLIEENKGNAAKVHFGLDALARTMVLAIKGNAQRRAGGPIARTRRSNPAFANRIPVQRITGAYFEGWKVQRLGMGHWMVYNTSKEAWLIEYGIYQTQRRPVLKMSTIDMMRLIERTATIRRFAQWLVKPQPRSSLGTFLPRTNMQQGSFALGLTAGDMPHRGATNPHIKGPSGRLPG